MQNIPQLETIHELALEDIIELMVRTGHAPLNPREWRQGYYTKALQIREAARHGKLSWTVYKEPQGSFITGTYHNQHFLLQSTFIPPAQK